jgi:hypothetical protein
VPPSKTKQSGGIDLKEWCYTDQENKTCGAVHKKKNESLMGDKDDKDSSVVELKGKKYSISKLGSQVAIYAATTRAIGEYV